jgi:acetamidase/formamidase
MGVHICTGPVYVADAEPGDVLEVRIIDVRLRGCRNPAFVGKAFGSNAAAWWGFHYNDLLTEPKPREVITIYLAELGGLAQSEVFSRSSLDRAMRDAFRKMRRFLMTAKGLSEDEAISLMSVAVDFGVTQVVDANWGIHAILKKALFTD